MKGLLYTLIIISAISTWSCKDDEMIKDPMGNDNPLLPVKTNTTKVYMHYMPWFHSKEVSGYWGIHWRMANKNPETILPNGQRQIASHYYPLIGPYDSGDPDVIDYHLLLMKYAGIDGVLIDWYGSYNILDYGSNRTNANALIEGVKRTGLDFAIVYEEFTTEEVARRVAVTEIEAAQADVTYAQNEYFKSDRYIRIDNKPLLLTFGPRFFTTPAQWTEILSVLDPRPAFMPLWNHTHRTGASNTSGEFGWVDFNASLSELKKFYEDNDPEIKIGSAFPGFHDFYQQGGWGDSYGNVAHNDGITLTNTLNLTKSYTVPYLQLVTWNDFGEGTMFEPTVEFEYKYLETVQDYTGVTYRKSDLETIHTYFLKRKEHKGDAEAQKTLDSVFHHLNVLSVSKANELLQTL